MTDNRCIVLGKKALREIEKVAKETGVPMQEVTDSVVAQLMETHEPDCIYLIPGSGTERKTSYTVKSEADRLWEAADTVVSCAQYNYSCDFITESIYYAEMQRAQDLQDQAAAMDKQAGALWDYEQDAKAREFGLGIYQIDLEAN